MGEKNGNSVPTQEQITVIREMKYDEWFRLIDVFQSIWADIRAKQRKILVTVLFGPLAAARLRRFVLR